MTRQRSPQIGRRVVAATVVVVLAVGIWSLVRAPGDALDRTIASLLDQGIDGAVVALGPLGQNPEVRVYGTAGADAAAPLSGESRFRFASLTKPVTAAAISELIARNELTLEDRLPALLPDVAFADPHMRDITVHDLLRHTSGIDESADLAPLFLTPEDLQARLSLDAATQTDCSGIARAMAERPLASPPGTRVAYSNTGYCYLGLILEAKTGLSLEQAIHDLVPESTALSFDPASVTVAHDVPDPAQDLLVMRPEVAATAGGLVGSPADFHRFLARPLAPGATDPPPFELSEPSHYGLGWRVWPDKACPRRTHFGSMPGAYSVAMIDSSGNAMVVFFNGRPSEDWQPFLDLADAACDVIAAGS